MAALIAAMSLTPAFGAQKISNPDVHGWLDGDYDSIEGLIDGIDPDPSVGRHNTYAWCGEVFEQTDGDYLWVGMNRDLGSFVASVVSDIGTEGTQFPIDDYIDIPMPSDDREGRIYRQKLADNEAEWEMVYSNPAISGWRRMIVFNGDLYVCAGMTNALIDKYNYSMVLRFKADFKLGDEPEIVMWDILPKGTTEYFRAMCVYDGLLYIGTFDSKIYSTDGKNLTSLSPNRAGLGERHTGWNLSVDLLSGETGVYWGTSGPYGGQQYIWDIIGFNGHIYSFNSGDGFSVFKCKPGEDGVFESVEVVVGEDESAKYPTGFGLTKLMAASPFLHSVDGKDYVYVSTFANGPTMLGRMGAGNVKSAFEGLYAQSGIFRFDENDDWEVIAGDTSGSQVALDKNGDPIPYIGNQRAGFFAGNDMFANSSNNFYTWWMTEYNGKLYAGTWDFGVFQQYNWLFMFNVFADEMDENGVMGMVTTLVPPIKKIIGAFDAILGTAEEEGADTEAITKALSEAVAEPEASNAKTILKLTGAISGLLDKLPAGSLKDLATGLVELTEILIKYAPNLKDAVPKLLEALFAARYFILESSNPGGFDLFVSEDGVNFEPVTVDGFGLEHNYGARVLLPTDYGLYLLTANPYYGGQVWRVDDLEAGMQMNLPKQLELAKNESFTFPVRTVGISGDANITVELKGENAGAVKAEIVKRSTGYRQIEDYRSEVTLETNLLVYGGKEYKETRTKTVMDSYMYDVTLTLNEAIDAGDIEVIVKADGMEINKTTCISLAGSEKASPSENEAELAKAASAAKAEEQAAEGSVAALAAAVAEENKQTAKYADFSMLAGAIGVVIAFLKKRKFFI